MAADFNTLRDYSNKVAGEISNYSIPASLVYRQWELCKYLVSELGSKIPTIKEAREKTAEIYEKTAKLQETVKKIVVTNEENGSNFVVDDEVKNNNQIAQQKHDILLELLNESELFNSDDKYAEALTDLCGLQMMMYHGIKSLRDRAEKLMNDCNDMINVFDTVKSYYYALEKNIGSIRQSQLNRFYQSAEYKDYEMNKNNIQDADLESIFASWWNRNLYNGSEIVPPPASQKMVVLYNE